MSRKGIEDFYNVSESRGEIVQKSGLGILWKGYNWSSLPLNEEATKDLAAALNLGRELRMRREAVEEKAANNPTTPFSELHPGKMFCWAKDPEKTEYIKLDNLSYRKNVPLYDEWYRFGVKDIGKLTVRPPKKDTAEATPVDEVVADNDHHQTNGKTPIDKIPVGYWYQFAKGSDRYCRKEADDRSLFFKIYNRGGGIEEVNELRHFNSNNLLCYPSDPPTVIQHLMASGLVKPDFDWSTAPMYKATECYLCDPSTIPPVSSPLTTSSSGATERSEGAVVAVPLDDSKPDNPFFEKAHVDEIPVGSWFKFFKNGTYFLKDSMISQSALAFKINAKSGAIEGAVQRRSYQQSRLHPRVISCYPCDPPAVIQNLTTVFRIDPLKVDWLSLPIGQNVSVPPLYYKDAVETSIDKLSVGTWYKLEKFDSRYYYRKEPRLNDRYALAFRINDKGLIEDVRSVRWHHGPFKCYPCRPPVAVENLAVVSTIPPGFKPSTTSNSKATERSEGADKGRYPQQPVDPSLVSHTSNPEHEKLSKESPQNSEDPVEFATLSVGQQFRWAEDFYPRPLKFRECITTDQLCTKGIGYSFSFQRKNDEGELKSETAMSLSLKSAVIPVTNAVPEAKSETPSINDLADSTICLKKDESPPVGPAIITAVQKPRTDEPDFKEGDEVVISNSLFVRQNLGLYTPISSWLCQTYDPDVLRKLASVNCWRGLKPLDDMTGTIVGFVTNVQNVYQKINIPVVKIDIDGDKRIFVPIDPVGIRKLSDSLVQLKDLPVGTYFFNTDRHQCISDRTLYRITGITPIYKTIVTKAAPTGFMGPVSNSLLVLPVNTIRAKEIMPDTMFNRIVKNSTDNRVYRRHLDGSVVAYGRTPKGVEKFDLHSDEMVKLYQGPAMYEEIYPSKNRV